MKLYTSIGLLLFSFFAYTQQVKKVTLCWDVSHSMKDRDTFREFYFLDAYFKTIGDAQVDVVTFSNQVLSNDSYAVDKGDWNAIKESLAGLSHDGATSFQNLAEYVSESDEVLLFTDGYQNMGNGTPQFNGDLFIINGKEDFDRANLNLLAIVNNGNLVNLPERKDFDGLASQKVTYSGIVYEGVTGVSDANIFVKANPDVRSKTDDQGNYSIDASVGDTLVVSHNGRTSEFALNENRNINFLFNEKEVQLKEVVVEGEKIEAPVDNTVTTGYGKENKDKIGYAVQSISEDDISDISYTANNAVQGKFSGVHQLRQEDDLSQIRMRPSNSILGNNYGLIVIDGVPISRTKSSSSVRNEEFNGQSLPITIVNNTRFIDPKNIAEITVLKGLAATNRFGSMGANGVLLITTKTSQIAGTNGAKPDLARLKDNIYDGKINVSNKTLVTPYLKELKAGKNVKEAYDIYLKQRKGYWDRSEYLLDVFEFFHAANPEIAERVLSNILEKENPAYEELRGMYLKCVEKENYDLALMAAHKKMELYPNKTQSYLDVARAENYSGNHQGALDMLNSMLSGAANPELNFNTLEKVVGTETRNLINAKRKALEVSKVDAKYQNNVTYNARIVLDWNNPDSEFVVQFVNPQKRFFNWEHTQLANRATIQNELRDGFSNEQFEIVGADTKGNWILNVTYLGNRNPNNTTPTFLKCKVQYNFGRPNQSSKEFLVRLHEIDQTMELAKFQVD